MWWESKPCISPPSKLSRIDARDEQDPRHSRRIGVVAVAAPLLLALPARLAPAGVASPSLRHSSHSNSPSPTVASPHSYSQGGPGGGPPPPSNPFKLKFKLGGASATASSTSPAPSPPVQSPVPVPQPPVVAPVPVQAQPPVPPPAPFQPPPPVESRPVQPVNNSDEGPPETRTEHARPDPVADSEEERVPASKYRALKRKYEQVVESRDDTSTALFRAQKLIHRLRKEKTSLLDRVMLLESAAGLSPPEILAAQEAAEAATSSQPFPLLHQPLLPSLKDRPRPQPVITTATDLSQSNYNDPLGPVPLPQSLPPRQRSHHLLSTIAADKLRESHEAKRVARGLLKAPYPAVAVLGLEGSYVAENVERAMAGERFGEAGASGEVGAGKSSGGGGGTKRRRESSVGGSSTVKAKARAPIETLQGLPNPFAGFGAVPVGAPEPTPPPPSVSASGRHASSQLDNDVDMPDGSQSPGSIMYSEDEDGGAGVDVKPKERRHRKMEGDKVIKPKRVKAHGITSGTFQIPRVPRYPDGTPQLPLPVGIMVLRNLGVITPREHFHTERYIFPIGFESMRKYPSMIDPTETVEYSCQIVDGGNNAPRFEIHPADRPGFVVTAGTPTGAWSQVVKAANLVRARNQSNSVSGPDYFGLAQNVVKALIQELPGARDVPDYIWQTFEESDSATAAGDEKVNKKKDGGPKKVVGAKRKAKVEPTPAPAPIPQFAPTQSHDDDLARFQQQHQTIAPHHLVGGIDHHGLVEHDSYADDRSSSPMSSYSAGAGGGGYTDAPYGSSMNGSAPFHGLLQSSNADPYSLPPPMSASTAPPQHSPPAFYDPFAIPPPRPPSSSSYGGSPLIGGGVGGSPVMPAWSQTDPRFGVPPPGSNGMALDPSFLSGGGPPVVDPYGIPPPSRQHAPSPYDLPGAGQ